MLRKPAFWTVLPALLSLFMTAHPAHARWATDEDVPAEIEFENDEIEVHADGTYESTTENQIRILKESARNSMATSTQTYNSAIEKLEVLDAKTIVDGKSISVDRKKIEDKPLASSLQGFDQHNQVLLAYPEVKVGASVYSKVKRVETEAPFPGFFSTQFVYGASLREKSGRIRISSEIPLLIEKNDPEHVLQIEEIRKGSTHQVTITLTRPVYKVAVDEASPYLDPKNYPWVSISTMKDWSEVARHLAPQYEKVLTSELPPRFEAIRAKAEKKGTLNERLNTITSELAAQVHYLGDWRTQQGMYVPRPLATIADTQYGDCKDYSAVTAAILRKLGYEADVAWTYRGNFYRRYPIPFAMVGDFNHAIVHLKEKDSGQSATKDRWIDPTNFTSFAQGIYRDISSRPAVVVSETHGATLRTPDSGASDAEVRITRVVHFAPEEKLAIDGKLELKGFSAVGYTGAALTHSKRSLDYDLTRYFADQRDLIDWKVENYDLTSRIVRDLEFRSHLTQRDTPMRTSAGSAYYLGSGSPESGSLLVPIENRVSDLVLSTPYTNVTITELRDVKPVGQASLDCEIRSPWVDVSREVMPVLRGVRIEEKTVIKKQVIPNTELRSKGFAQVRDQIRTCLSGAAIVYERLPGTGEGTENKRGLASEETEDQPE